LAPVVVKGLERGLLRKGLLRTWSFSSGLF